MNNFFRKIPKSLVAMALVFAVLPGYALAVEGDPDPVPPDVTPPVSADSSDTPDSPNTGDAPGGSLGTSEDGASDLPGGDTVTVSGADVTVNVEKHDTLSVASNPADTPDSPSNVPDNADSSALVQTIRSLFGAYTPRTQTVTTYYDGQPIATEEQIVPGLAGLDFEWLTGVGMFAMITFCLFRLLGGVVRNG